jgi:hypothetical protein
MKYKFLKLVTPIGIGLLLLVLTIVGLQGCEKDACNNDNSSLDQCLDCLNSKGGYNFCPSGYSFVQWSKCQCN